MTGEFKVVYRSDPSGHGENRTTWVPGCPLLAETVQVARDAETGDAYLQLEFVNASGFPILSFKAQAVVQYEDGSSEEIDVSTPDANIWAGQAHEPTARKLARSDASSAQVVIDQVVGDLDTWERAGADPLPLPANDMLMFPKIERDERRRLLQQNGCTALEAVDMKLLSVDNWWLCACQTLNVDRKACRACGMSKTQLEQLEDEAFLAESASTYAAEVNERRAAVAKKRKRQTNAVGIAAIVVAIILAAVLLFLPSQPSQSSQPSLEDRLEAHTWQMTTTATTQSGKPKDITVNATFKDGKLTFTGLGQTISEATYAVSGNDTIEAVSSDGKTPTGTWRITFSNDDRTMTLDPGGYQVELQAVD